MFNRARNLAAAIGLAISVVSVACASTAPAPTPNTVAPAKAPGASAPAKSEGSSVAAGDVSNGQAVFAAKCAACHGQNAKGGVGPDLRKIGATRDHDFLTRWLSDPQAVKPSTTMPKIPLSQAELEALVEYMVALK